MLAAYPRSCSVHKYRAQCPQKVFDREGDFISFFELPEPEAEVLPGINWGLLARPFTPAFWAAQVWMHRKSEITKQYRWGASIIDELVGCILGGHGITFEMNLAAFLRLHEMNLLECRENAESAINRALSDPLTVSGRARKYRYPNQKAKYISSALRRIKSESAPETPIRFREWLLTFDGVGYKTASWVTRNLFGSAKMAVIDIHILRAMMIMNLAKDEKLDGNHYIQKENRFVAFSEAIHCDIQTLDCVMWKTMRSLPSLTRQFRVP